MLKCRMLSTPENVHIVVDEWIETAELLGREIPKPKGKLAFA